MLGKGLRLPFRLLGIPVLLDISFLVVLPLLAWSIGRNLRLYANFLDLGGQDAGLLESGFAPYLLGLVAALGLFASVLAHELGHAVTARAYGVQTRAITLWILGGIAQFDQMPRRRGAEAVVAIVGPLVSFALGLLLWLTMHLLPPALVAAKVVFAYLAITNVALAVFNLLPALPLDGGRVLRSLMALRMDHLRATRISATISRTLAIVLGIAGLLLNPWLILIAVFVFMAANAETQHSVIDQALEGLHVRDLMSREVAAVSPLFSVVQVAQRMFDQHHLTFPVIDDMGRPLGLISARHLAGAYPHAAVEQVMAQPAPTIAASASAVEAYSAMAEQGTEALVVLDEHGQAAGVLTQADLARAVQLGLIQASFRRPATSGDFHWDAGHPLPSPVQNR
jgi:Zn-dependent protease/CBS domain-containing protein